MGARHSLPKRLRNAACALGTTDNSPEERRLIWQKSADKPHDSKKSLEYPIKLGHYAANVVRTIRSLALPLFKA